jgi:hypothetical protein
MDNHPKLNVTKVIQKAFISLNIKQINRIPVYYKWDKRLPNMKKLPFVIIDYDMKTREWFVYYVRENGIQSCTVDDITGTTFISNE